MSSCVPPLAEGSVPRVPSGLLSLRAAAAPPDGGTESIARAGVGGAQPVSLAGRAELDQPLLAVGNHRGDADAAQRRARQFEGGAAAMVLEVQAVGRYAQTARLIA